MAQEQTAPPTKNPWTKIFTAFKVALDIKKLALAAAGIFFAWLGWAILSWTFYGMREMPKWEDKAFAPPDTATAAEKDAVWAHFMAKRASWNLVHELAGWPDASKPVPAVEAADVAKSLGEYEMLSKWGPGQSVEQATSLAAKEPNKELAPSALATYKTYLINPKIKPFGLLRVSPWSENRGENPYLIVADGIKTRGESVFGGGKFFSWFMTDEAPVVLEPLYKFLAPVVYLFDGRAGGWDRLYLIMMMLWTLFVWGFFGGAICRIAAVQAARNERITLREALLFTKERCWSYLAAPVFPMALVGILTLLLMIFGWIEWIPYFVGDVFAGVLWPIPILFGFIMAIVLVGLVGWPLMTATISTEGTDSFDALSRSYSYIYQAPWQYLWYSLVAVAYGAVLIFFVGFMASLMVFLGKWGVSSAVGPANSDPKWDREPSYLFQYAPTSFGWRSLLISSNSRFVEEKTVTDYDGRQVKRIEFKEDYELRPWEKTGAFLVAVWIYPLFLLVVGFGYSYFWSVSTIIYFLMRRHVDDTEMDEVHLEEEALDDPFLKPPPTPPVVAAPSPSKPGTVSLNVVEAPPPPPAPVVSTSYTTADHAPAPPVPSEAVNSPPENPPPGAPM